MKDVCPLCEKKELERVEQNDFNLVWLMDSSREWWECSHCGQAFFKKIEKKCLTD